MKPAGAMTPPPWMTAPAVTRVLAALMAEGGVARFVGGCVRDGLLERPIAEIDLAATGTPETNLRLLEAGGIRTVPTGLKHGTVTAVIDHQPFEITTLRVDVETYGRHARVAYTDDWAADAARRDFTMNAIYADADGTLYDPVGGIADLRAGRVRFVGDPAARIAEDRLRLLRFFRFFARYGRGEPEPAAFAACSAAAPELRHLSGERIQAELFKLLTAPRALESLRIMVREGIADHLLPAPADLDALARVIGAEAAIAARPDPVRRLAALLPEDAETVARLSERLRLSNADAGRLALLAAPPLRPDWDDPRQLPHALYRLGRQAAVDLALLDGSPQAAAALQALEIPRLPVRGADVVALGVPRGERVGQLLRAVEAWWIEGGFRADRRACLQRLAELDGGA